MLWGRKKVQESEDTQRTLERRIDEVESVLRRIKVEWEDVLDRLERMMGRLNKRAQRDATPEPANNTVTPSPSPMDVVLRRRAGHARPGLPEGS